MIQRQLEKTILSSIKPGFINVIYGPRRVGKTVLLESLVKNYQKDRVVFLNGDTSETREILGSTSEITLSELVKNKDVVVIDEAQRVLNIGLALKILVDKFPNKIFFVSGSSSLSLARGVKESLTGRTFKYKLYPLSTYELTRELPLFQKKSILESQLIFGGYPYLERISDRDEKRLYLKSIIEDYLFSDIKALKEILSEDIVKKLATLLAFQIGSIVSLNELSKSLGIDVKTVARYISLLKQGFVIFELGSFSNNPRKELTKSKKYYFWDLGIRNALTDQFLPIDTRTDTGALWENFLAIERVKKNEYAKVQKEYYFWRSYEKAEIDWLEIREGKISAFEFKWKSSKDRTPKAFRDAYKQDLKVVSKDNYLEFILSKQ